MVATLLPREIFTKLKTDFIIYVHLWDETIRLAMLHNQRQTIKKRTHTTEGTEQFEKIFTKYVQQINGHKNCAKSGAGKKYSTFK